MGARLLAFAIMLPIAVMASSSSSAEEDEDASPVEQRFVISPIPKSRLNLTGKDYAVVGGGTYTSMASQTASACQSVPEFLEQGNGAGSNPAARDPFEGTPVSRSARMSIANFTVQWRAQPRYSGTEHFELFYHKGPL